MRISLDVKGFNEFIFHGLYYEHKWGKTVFKSMEDTLQINTAGAVELDLPIAGIGGRAYAFVVDWHFRFIVAIAWFIAGAYFFGLFAEGGTDSLKDSGEAFVYIVIIPCSIIYFLYHPVLEIAMKGRTPGKRWAGVRIVDLQGRTPTIGAILIRNIFRIIDSLPTSYVVGICAVMLTKSQVRIGDMAAGTLLVYEDKPKTAAIEAITETAARGRLTTVQSELLQELLERWSGLEVDARLRLGNKFMQSIDEALPEGGTKAILAGQLYTRLSELQQGSE